MSGRYKVITDWTAAYGDPIVLRAGDMIHLSGREDDWDGHRWLWARSEAGKEGWIPDTLPLKEAGAHHAATGFSAVELTCHVGEVLSGSQETHGWILCRDETGRDGWVPARCLQRL